MPEIRKQQHRKIVKDEIPRPSKRCMDELDYPIFCFHHLTKNSKFNFSYFDNTNDKLRKAKKLLLRFEELSSNPWGEIIKQDKTKGFETIPYNQMRFTPHDLTVSNDSKMHVFRFGNRKDGGRIIGYKSDKCHTIIHVVAFDFEFNAYNH